MATRSREFIPRSLSNFVLCAGKREREKKTACRTLIDAYVGRLEGVLGSCVRAHQGFELVVEAGLFDSEGVGLVQRLLQPHLRGRRAAKRRKRDRISK